MGLKQAIKNIQQAIDNRNTKKVEQTIEAAVKEPKLHQAISIWYQYQDECKKRKVEYNPDVVALDVAKKMLKTPVGIYGKVIPLLVVPAKDAKTRLEGMLDCPLDSETIPFSERLQVLNVTKDRVFEQYSQLRVKQSQTSIIAMTEKMKVPLADGGEFDFGLYDRFACGMLEEGLIEQHFNKKLGLTSEIYETGLSYGLTFFKNMISQNASDESLFASDEAIAQKEIIEESAKRYISKIDEEPRKKLQTILDEQCALFESYKNKAALGIIDEEKKRYHSLISIASPKDRTEEERLGREQTQYATFCTTYAKTLGLTQESFKAKMDVLKNIAVLDCSAAKMKETLKKNGEGQYGTKLLDEFTSALDKINKAMETYSINLNGTLGTGVETASRYGIEFLFRYAKTNESGKPEMSGTILRTKENIDKCISKLGFGAVRTGIERKFQSAIDLYQQPAKTN